MYIDHRSMRYVCHDSHAYCSFRFASKPKKGIEFLQDKQLLSSKPEDVARFFHNDIRLNRTATGEYLGERNE